MSEGSRDGLVRMGSAGCVVIISAEGHPDSFAACSDGALDAQSIQQGRRPEEIAPKKCVWWEWGEIPEEDVLLDLLEQCPSMDFPRSSHVPSLWSSGAELVGSLDVAGPRDILLELPVRSD